MILTLNIETAPDKSCPTELLPKPEDFYPEFKKPETLKEKAAEAMSKLSLSPLTGRIICVASKIDDATPRVIVGEDEKSIVAEALALMSKATRVVTFNGKSFDMPYIMIAGARHGLNIPARFLRLLAKYDTEHHVDVRNVLTNFNQFGKGKLGQWATRFGIEPPYGDGSKVESWYNNQMWDEISRHSMTNVEATYLIYKRLELFV